MRLSEFGRNFTAGAGILSLMDDLGRGLASEGGHLMLGGGNPAHIGAVQYFFRERMQSLLDSGNDFERMIGDYSSPGGSSEFIRELAALFRREYGWDVSPENIALTNGSQAAFFFLFNMFGGCDSSGVKRKVLFPLVPEYIGYADLGLEPGIFSARRPLIEEIGDHVFKYHIDFENLVLGDDIGALCVSRPTNPSGNVLTDAELSRLADLAAEKDIPLIIDNAYGLPFPGIIFTEAELLRRPNVILSMSLSKLGLPGTRTGIVLAEPGVIRALASMNAIFNLAPGNIGSGLVGSMVADGSIIRISREIIRPFYYEKSRRAFDRLGGLLKGTPFRLHSPEGALFLWLWLPGLPISSAELYERLMKRGVIIVSGHFFFPGLEGEWRHRDECIRITFAQRDEVVDAGLEIIAEEVRKAYDERS